MPGLDVAVSFCRAGADPAYLLTGRRDAAGLIESPPVRRVAAAAHFFAPGGGPTAFAGRRTTMTAGDNRSARRCLRILKALKGIRSMGFQMARSRRGSKTAQLQQ